MTDNATKLRELLENEPSKRPFSIRRFLRRHNRALLVLAVVLLGVLWLWGVHHTGHYYLNGVRHEL